MKEKIRKKGFKKRLFSVALALAMVVSLMPGMSLTVKASDSTQKVGIYDIIVPKGANLGGANAETTVKEFPTTNTSIYGAPEIYMDGGWYVVNGNVSIDNTFDKVYTSGSINLILNGNLTLNNNDGFDMGESGSLTVWSTNASYKLTITGEKDGVISGASGVGPFVINGGEVKVSVSTDWHPVCATITTVNGGKLVVENTNKTGDYVYALSRLIVNDGEVKISGDYAAESENLSIKGGTVEFIGSEQAIKRNGEENYLDIGPDVVVRTGDSAASATKVTKGSSETWLSKLAPESGGPKYIKISPKHKHTWDYAVDDITLTATCTCKVGDAEYDDCEYKDIDAEDEGRKVSLTLEPISLTYDGWSKTFGDTNALPSAPDIKITGYNDWYDVFGENPAVGFSADDGQTWTDGHASGSENRPSAIGDYKIKIYPARETESATNTIIKNFSIEGPINVTKQDGTDATSGTDYDLNAGSHEVTLYSDDLIVSGGSSTELVDYILKIGDDSHTVNSVTLKNLYLSSYIRMDYGTPVLKLEGTNQIGNEGEVINRAIIPTVDSFTVTGSGNLTIYDRYDGIYSNNTNITFDSKFTGILTINDTGDIQHKCAINIGAGTLTVENGTLNLKSEKANGITAGAIKINGGTVIAQGGEQAMSVAPTLGTGIKVNVASENIDGSSATEYKAESINSYKYLKISKSASNSSSGSGGSSYTPPATSATISGETGATTNVSVNTSGGQATVSDIPKDTVESIANSKDNGGDIVLDVSNAGNSQVTKVTLTKNTVENISKALDSGDNNKTNLVVKTGNAEVAFDAAAVKAIAEQANAESIQIVVENTTGANLNNNQKKVVEDLGKGNGEKQVVQTFEASIISGGKKISNFMGGNVTVAQINFTVPAGKKAANYHIYYIPASGAAERCVTWVKDGRIYFVTGHFSDYVIVYDEAVSNGEGIPVYRLYHNKLGDHLFTTNAAERDAVQKIGYKLESVGFYASGTGNKVYRLFNKNSGEHFYTTSEAEKKVCEAAGWRFEGVAFTTVGEKKVYRLYNGKVHFYTTSEKEKDFCEAHGWKLEGVGFTAN